MRTNKAVAGGRRLFSHYKVVMIDRIYEYMNLHRMTEPGDRVLAAVSGGADSMCLLEVLAGLRDRLGIRLQVLHVHHGLRESAEGDLLYVKEYCGKAGIPFEAVRVDAARYASDRGLSLEEAARILRYEALHGAADRLEGQSGGRCRIAVAHHLEDQAETVLFNLVRGSRLTGLRGMLPVSGRIIRPLLDCSRPEIEAFLARQGISWRTDETNEDLRYTRNRIRREVMPLLAGINSGAQKHIALAAQEAAETEDYLREETRRALYRVRTGKENALSASALLKEPPLLARRAVYEEAARAAGKKDLQNVHIEAVLRLCRKPGSGSVTLPGGVRVEKVYDRLYFGAKPCERPGLLPLDPDEAQGRQAGSPQQTPVPWPLDPAEYRTRVFGFDGDLSALPRNQYTKWLDYDKIGTFPDFRTRRTGDRIALDDSGRSKTLARYMIDEKIPAAYRDRMILPAAGSEILWVPQERAAASKADAETVVTGGRISAAYKVTRETKRILELQWEPDK